MSEETTTTSDELEEDTFLHNLHSHFDFERTDFCSAHPLALHGLPQIVEYCPVSHDMVKNISLETRPTGTCADKAGFPNCKGA